MTDQHSLRPTALEIAAGIALGHDRDSPPLPDLPKNMTPLQALEQAVLPALQRPPCVVSFSGGRDSSLVLAVATRVARGEGLALPIPATLRYPGVPAAEESEWQELVISHLRLQEWHRQEITNELDILSPVSRRILVRHGVLWPPNAYVHVPLFEVASGGSVMTGLDGDGLLGAWRWRPAADVLARREPPTLRNLLRVAHAVAPVPVRKLYARLREPLRHDWLTRKAQRQMTAARLSELAAQPTRWDARVHWYASLRYPRAAAWSLATIASDFNVEVVNPLFDGRFMVALALAGGRYGFGDRTSVLRAGFADILPDALLARASKATFDQAFWRDGAMTFAKRWDGGGVNPELVDVERLRLIWASPTAQPRTGMLLQQAWLASGRDALGEGLQDLRQHARAARSGEAPSRQPDQVEQS